ncbi:glycine/D-amino acid oxidase-like deaminating enzyme [Limimaricola variabilis]|uniref:Glycine/D-amino acid oxidase-like deaminating enzyme n=1 Tax=Limimaricola variabilis TaxID=1492771 RepID=A0ABR6HQ76_9RHOB|nr:FAD-binding oxidoreductase [Limimaricola variabilis]MBB3712714.1 glycine/D-amino acid oxidase-like deaminating enzyme [Limimaricola variabilis]
MATENSSCDVAIIGGAMIGSAVAWWLARDPDFDGRILVIERDPSFEYAATSHTNSCIRMQFGTAVNVEISRFGLDFIRRFRDFAGAEAPVLHTDFFGYLYLAGDAETAERLRAAQTLQTGLGAGTRLLSPAQLHAAFPFMQLDDVILGSHNPGEEGYFDGGTMFDTFRRQGRAMGVETVRAEVVGLDRDGDRVTGLRLSDGSRVACGQVVAAAGPRTARIAAMAGIDLPIEPRKRYTFVFEAEDALPRKLPLTIDPSGVHMRSDGALYMAGCPPEADAPCAPEDFGMDHAIWEDRVWPALAARVPAFERIRLRNAWVGHYDFNRLDQNALLGPHPAVANLHFAAGFSGHGLQQAPAVGRGIAERIIHGAWRSIDLSPLSTARLAEGRALTEAAVI